MIDQSLLDSIVVEISRDGSAGCGTGFLVSWTEIVTCYHVLCPDGGNLQKRYWVRHDRLDQWIEVEPVEHLCHPMPRDTAVLHTYELGKFLIGDSEDVEDPFFEINEAWRRAGGAEAFVETDYPSRSRYANWNKIPTGFVSKGYDRTKRSVGLGATTIEGEIIGTAAHQGFPRLQLRTREGSVIQGRSGSPIWSKNQRAIVGILAFVGGELEAKPFEMALGIPIVYALPETSRAVAISHPSTFRIQITGRYRTKLRFSLVSTEGAHWAVHRLFLRYLNEFHWDPAAPAIEAIGITRSYEIALSRRYSEYDLLPQTPDNGVHPYVYRGVDSDYFGVDLVGTNVSLVRICAELMDMDTGVSWTVESEDIKIIASSVMEPLWEQPLGVKGGRLLERLSPVTYKALTSLDYEDFIAKLGYHHLTRVQRELIDFGEELKNSAHPPKATPFPSISAYRKQWGEAEEKRKAEKAKRDANRPPKQIAKLPGMWRQLNESDLSDLFNPNKISPDTVLRTREVDESLHEHVVKVQQMVNNLLSKRS